MARTGTEEKMKKAYLAGDLARIKKRELRDLTRSVTRINLNKGNESISFLNESLKDFNAQGIKEKYLSIISLDKKYLGGIGQVAKTLIEDFERNHKDLCYHIASLNPWRQEYEN